MCPDNALLAIVNGATRLYGIIGDPIDQVKSPEVMTARFRAAGRNALMLPLHVKPNLFDETIGGLKVLGNLDGITITVPYKVRILSHVDRLLPTAARIGAVNVMRREADGTWIGEMFDGQGFLRGLRQNDVDPRGRRAMLIGAGGAGSAIADALAEAGAAAITLFDLDQGKADSLAHRIRKSHPACVIGVGAATAAGYDLLVNATPTGMAPGDGLPLELPALSADVFVMDVVTKPEVTPLLALARANGCRTMCGRGMMEGQAELMAGFFGIEG